MPRSRYVIFAAVALSMLVYTTQFTMVSVALPELTDDLNAPLRWSGWVLTVFMIGQVITAPLAGRLAEQFGAHRIFAAGFIVFTLASLSCALATDIYWLIGSRAVQGMAGGTMMPSGMGIVGVTFKDDRARWIGLLGSVLPIGGVIGPSLGGAIVDLLGWRWTFALNVPLGTLAVLAALAILPRTPRRANLGRLDFTGIGMLAISTTALIYALTEMGRRDADPAWIVVAIGLAMAFVGFPMLVRREARIPHPAIDMTLLRRREFMFVNTLAFFFGAGIFGMFSMIPLYAQSGYGMTATETGALVTPRSIAMVSVSMLAALLLPYTGYRKPIIIGMLGTAAALFVISLGIEEPSIAGVQISNFVWLAFIVCCTGIAFGMLNPSLNNAALDLAPDRIPAIVGLRAMFMSLGGTVGVSLILLVVSRSGSTAAGLETAFTGMAIMLVGSAALVFGIPEMVRRRQAVPVPATDLLDEERETQSQPD